MNGLVLCACSAVNKKENGLSHSLSLPIFFFFLFLFELYPPHTFPVFPDPRFEATAGDYKSDLFRSNYGFLSEMRDKEIEALEAAKKAAKRSEEREELGSMLSTLKQHRGEAKHAADVRRAELGRKQAERKAVETGKAPYFPKKRELRDLAARVKFSALESASSGAADKAIQRRRKKVLAMERRSAPLPFRVRETGLANK